MARSRCGPASTSHAHGPIAWSRWSKRSQSAPGCGWSTSGWCKALRESEDLYRDLSQETGTARSGANRASSHDASEQIGATLREKEVLLKEGPTTGSRSNLQVVSSLLDLQKSPPGRGKSSEAVLRDCANRVKSMSSWSTEALSSRRDLSRLDFGRLCKRQLAEESFRSSVSGRPAPRVALAVDVCEMSAGTLRDTHRLWLVVERARTSNALKLAASRTARWGEVRVPFPGRTPDEDQARP